MGTAIKKKPSRSATKRTKRAPSKDNFLGLSFFKRDSVLYARVCKENKDWVDKQASAHGIPTSQFVELFLTRCRENLVNV